MPRATGIVRVLCCLSSVAAAMATSMSVPPPATLVSASPRARSFSRTPCTSPFDCPGATHLCLADGFCRRVIAAATELAGAPPHGSLPDSCFISWPGVKNCATWNTSSNTLRVLESNNVPTYQVPPYCPFGVGQGYCQSPTVGNSSNCAPFAGRVCPCTPPKEDDLGGDYAVAEISDTVSVLRSLGAIRAADDPPGPGNGTTCPPNTTTAGDVLTPVYQRFEFPVNPDPTSPSKPLHMYNNSALKTGNTYQVIGALLNGVQVKGPAEANGFNVDLSLIPLPCGGHVTPPVGPGPVYHYHKAADCIEQPTDTGGSHAPLIGYAADGFGIYGFADYNGEPVLDECNGKAETDP